jgi:hypothetical protein
MVEDKWSEYQLLNYFQTSIRNVGLYTSLSFAALAASRYYKDSNNRFRRNGFISLGLFYIFITLVILKNLILHYGNHTNEHQLIKLEPWYIIPYMLCMTNIVMLIYGLYLFF